MVFECDNCGQSFSRKDHMLRHKKKHEGTDIFRCSGCQQTFSRKDNLTKHRKRAHNESGLEPVKLWKPWEGQPTTSAGDENLDSSFDESESEYSRQVQDLITAHHEQITTRHHKTKRVQDRYNFQTSDPDKAQLRAYLEEIVSDQTTAFKLNVSFGFILRNIQTQGLSYYYASNNSRLFSHPILIQSRDDIGRVLTAIENEDLLEYCRLQRPNSSFKVETITNIQFYVSKLKSYRIGCPVNLPHFIRNNPGIRGLEKNWHSVAYDDNLCLFRCLALSRGVEMAQVDGDARALMVQWLRYTGYRPQPRFEGVAMSDLSIFEQCFGVCLDVYDLRMQRSEDDDVVYLVAHQVWRSIEHPDRPKLAVNLHQNHFSYIKDMGLYCHRWSCTKCGKLWPYHSRCLQHERSCDDNLKVRFKGGGYGYQRTIIDELALNLAPVRSSDEFYPYRIAYDFDAFSKPLITVPNHPKGATRVLKPASVSVCSNVPGFTDAKCFVAEDEDCAVLMDNFFTYICEISAAASGLLFSQRKDTFDYLDQKIERRTALKQKGPGASPAELAEADRLQVFEILKSKYTSWLKSIVVLGFNSGKFDINLIRSYLFPYLLEKDIPIRIIIKKGSTYQCVGLDQCMFLDMRNYLSPSVSYDKWIKSLGIQQQKAWFPYRWLQNATDLNTPHLVARSEFWSELKQSGISEENYKTMERVWHEQGFQSMKDLLIWYNNLDVSPFVTAAEYFYNHWKVLGIDPFKSGSISLPGLALTHLMKTLPKHVILPLIPEKFKDIYYCIRSNIVGGLSAVFHRYHESGVTALPDGRQVRAVISKDANGLYLYCLGLETGTGIMIVWRTYDVCKQAPVTTPGMTLDESAAWEMDCVSNLSAKFSKQSMYPMCQKELEWLEWYSHENDCSVQHRFNGGQFVIPISKSTKYPVDGYVHNTKTVLQFHGCYWHGHGCRLDGPQPNFDRLAETNEVTANIRALGYAVIEMWECQWVDKKRASAALQQFLHAHVNLTNTKSVLSGFEILNHIVDGVLFGLIECDLEVPRFDDELNDYFKEFPPIFKNTDVSIDDIGDLMKQYAEQFGFLKQPRRCLISSYFARKILLPTPLLKWYLQKGLVVTRIYQFIQMKPKRCFQHLADEVTQHRRAADADIRLAPVGSTWKDTGNHYYGKTATDKFKHKQVQVMDDYSASRAINDKRFCSMEEVGASAYEVTMDKKVIKIDLPVTVAFFVYGGAKLRMLEFVYDFIKKYLTPGSYQIVCMDTDSIIAAYASDDIDELVKPELMHEYLAVGKPQFLAVDKDSQRTPGLFKDELTADGVIALCSKTYFAWGKDTTKAVSKGLSKVTNNFTREDYMDVLQTGTRGQGVNHGFKISGDHIFQYQQTRRSLSYLYIKRKVLDDGISTAPLDL